MRKRERSGSAAQEPPIRCGAGSHRSDGTSACGPRGWRAVMMAAESHSIVDSLYPHSFTSPIVLLSRCSLLEFSDPSCAACRELSRIFDNVLPGMTRVVLSETPLNLRLEHDGLSHRLTSENHLRVLYHFSERSSKKRPLSDCSLQLASVDSPRAAEPSRAEPQATYTHLHYFAHCTRNQPPTRVWSRLRLGGRGRREVQVRVVLGLVRELVPAYAPEPHDADEREHEQPDHVAKPEPREPAVHLHREEEPARHADHEHAHKCGAPSLAGAERVAHPDRAADADAEQRHEGQEDDGREDAVGRDHDARVRQEAREQRDEREAEHLERHHEHARDAELGDLGHERHGFLRPPAGPRGLEDLVLQDHWNERQGLDDPAQRVRERDAEVPERRVERQHVRRCATHEPANERRGHEREHNVLRLEEHRERDRERVHKEELARDVRDRRVLSECLENTRATQEHAERERHAEGVHDEPGLAVEPELGHLLGAVDLRAERVDRGREAAEQPGDEEHLHEAREAERREDLRALVRTHVPDHHREHRVGDELEQRREDHRNRELDEDARLVADDGPRRERGVLRDRVLLLGGEDLLDLADVDDHDMRAARARLEQR
ncbi:hypothetical protein PybrP1_006539 [[Pythium] brassicae (nom. inval.)]|nr:hypothetical protein PybrP1_006539 [[Pythium] brassicae (nom. inval.)]